MLSKKKINTYFIYAFGEIFLVIIGILIALGINEKRAERNNNTLRDVYLIQLIDEADHNLDRLVGYRDFAISGTTRLDTLLQMIYDEDYRNQKFYPLSNTLYSRKTFNGRKITYENLKFSGDLKLFDDLNLRNAIIEAYQSFDLIKVTEKRDHDVVSRYEQDYLIPYAGTDNFGKDIYFRNITTGRRITMDQIRDASEVSIQSIERLKTMIMNTQDLK